MTEDTNSNTAVSSGEGEAPASSPDESKTTSSDSAQVAGGTSGSQGTQQQGSESTPQQQARDTSEGGKGQSDRASKRYQDLANKVRKKSEQVESLRERLESQRDRQSRNAYQQNPDLGALGGPPGPGEVRELSWDDYQKHVQNAADRIVNLRLSQYEQTRKRERQVRKDLSQVEKKYPELDKSSDQFNKDLSKRITSLYEKAGGAKAGIPLRGFVENVMEVRNDSRTEGKKEATQTLSKQREESAVSPESSAGELRINNEEQLQQAIKNGDIDLEEAEKYLS